MSNTNNNLQTQTSNALYNAIMEVGGKDLPLMLAPGNYVQWKSIIKRYIDTKPDNELIHYCLKNPPYNLKWTEKTIPVTESSSETTIEGYMENYKNVSQDIRNQLDAEAESFLLQLQPEWQRFVTLVKHSQELKIVSYHKLYDILKQHQNEVSEIRVKRLAHTTNPLALVAQQQPVYHPQNHPKPEMVAEDNALSKEKEIDKLMALISLSFKKIYKPTNNNLRTSSNTSRAHQDNTPRINRGTRYDHQRVVNVARARENVGIQVDAAYHKEKMILCKQKEARIQLGAEQADWRDDTDDEPEDQELESHYLYMAKIQEVTQDAAENSGPIFDAEPLQKVQNDDDNYNVFAKDREHHVQPKSVNDTYLEEQGDTNITIKPREMVDQDDDDLAKECDLLASLIEKLKCKIDDSKNRNKLLESSNKTLVGKLKGEIEDFKTKNKSLESSNNHFKKANNELSKTNQLMFKDLKKFQAELDRYHDVNYASKVEIDYAKAK
ncbi:hypothetical protein Tco_0646449 [Tanacetum coccineum]